MSKCLRCNRKIAQKTAKKYLGYSRACLQKHEQELLPATFEEVASSLAKVNYQIGVDYTIKTIFKSTLDKQEFAWIYCIPKHLVDSYYDKYLVKLVSQIII
jgi:hypothetical protein